MRTRIFCLALLVAAALPLAAADQAAAPARFTFIKIFPGSLPEYTGLTVAEDGAATYDGRSLQELPHPENFRLPADLTAQLFTYAAALNFFQGVQLDSSRRIANLGRKTFRFEKGAERNEVEFNYTENAAANALLDLCEKIARSRFHIARLEFKLRFDRLGMLETLREFEYQFNNKALIYYEQFIPVLTQIAQDSRLVRLAQTRAQRLLERIRGAPAQVRYEQANEQTGWYLAVNLSQDGSATYEIRRLDQPPDPQPLQVSERLRERIFAALAQADFLRGSSSASDKLPGGVRLTYEAGHEYNQVGFSTPPTAALSELTRLFRQLLTQIEFRTRLARALEQDVYELPLVLRDLEQALSQGALAEPAEFVPALERVLGSQSYYEEEQALARKILERIRPKP